MSNTYIWNIKKMYCSLSENGQTNVVKNVEYTVTATNSVNTVMVSGLQPITYISENSFTPYSSLTESQVISWIKDSMSATQIAAIEASLDNEIKNQTNPVTVIPALPWA